MPINGRHLSDEHKKKLSILAKGRKFKPLSEQHKDKIRISCQKIIRTDEWKNNIKQSKLGNKNPNFGKTTSEETKNKIRESHRKRKLM